ncbi:hypothetical protein [Mycobacterium sp. NPDC004974]
MIAHLLTCPACGLFGIRGRRRNRRAEDAALVRFHAQLAAEVRAERHGPRITLFDGEGRKIAGPITERDLAAIGVELVPA